jgi:hypothetical protein
VVGTVEIKIWGDDRGVQAMLHRLDTALNPVAVLGFLQGEVGPYLAQRAASRFAGEGDDVVGRWKPLSDATQEWRRKGREQGQWEVGDAHPINVRTHELEDYITGGAGEAYPLGSGAALAFPSRNPPKSRGLQEKMKTAQVGRKRTPARPVIGLNEQDLLFVLTGLAFQIKGRPGKP